jgi:hypothetical protein
MGRRGWDGSDGLVLDHCNSVHSFFMRMPIDVAFVDKSGRVLKTVERLAPWRIAPIAWRAAWTLELPAGRLAESGTRVGDELRLVDA